MQSEISEETLETRELLIRRMRDPRVTTALIGQATKAAVLEHKRNGNPIATWRDGKVVIVQPEDIEVDEPDV